MFAIAGISSLFVDPDSSNQKFIKNVTTWIRRVQVGLGTIKEKLRHLRQWQTSISY